MIRRLLIILIFGFITTNLQSQHLSEVTKYFVKSIKENNLGITEYLTFSKPNGKWDTRPLKKPFIVSADLKDTIVAKSIPNFVWGAIGNKSFQLSVEELQKYPNDFLAEGYYNKEQYLKEFIPKNKAAMIDIINDILKSDGSLFVQQKQLPHYGYERVDNIFRENTKYWHYILPKDSPLQLSNEIAELPGHQYSFQDEEILNKLITANCYCVTKIGDQIVFMTGGQLDNSIGFIFSKEKPTNKSLGPLFDLMIIEKAEDNFYFYVSR